MPIYDYVCKNCKKIFDQMFSSFAKAEQEKGNIECPACASKNVEKQISSATSFQLKGKGWAKDRYGK